MEIGTMPASFISFIEGRYGVLGVLAVKIRGFSAGLAG
jgi:hypothetical protein